jgi:hypothetical protein
MNAFVLIEEISLRRLLWKIMMVQDYWCKIIAMSFVDVKLGLLIQNNARFRKKQLFESGLKENSK